MVSFGNRRRSSGGAFYDYTARYGAVREEDRVTLRQSMFPESQSLSNITFANAHEKNADVEICPPEGKESPFFDELIEKMGLTSLLDIPLVALSNGQTRRARIVKAVLSKPELLLLDEPLSVSLYLDINEWLHIHSFIFLQPVWMFRTVPLYSLSCIHCILHVVHV